MIPSWRMWLNSTFATFSQSGGRRQERQKAKGPRVVMWCVVLCLTTVSLYDACVISRNFARRFWLGVATSARQYIGRGEGCEDFLPSMVKFVVVSMSLQFLISTLRPKCARKSAPRIGKGTSPKTNIQRYARRSPTSMVIHFFAICVDGCLVYGL